MVSLPDKSHALIIGASGGIGNAIATHIEKLHQSHVTRLSRRDDGFDITDENSIITQAEKFHKANILFSLILVATGTLEIRSAQGDVKGPERAFKALSPENATRAFAINALGPALIFKHFAKLMPRDSRAVFAALSARVGSISDNGLGGWMSYRASKAALNQFIRCAAIEHKRTHKENIVVALHPGTIDTPLTRQYARGRYTQSPEDAAHTMLTTLNNLTSEANGGFFAYDGSAISW